MTFRAGQIIEALQPLADIANAYEQEELDEVRPSRANTDPNSKTPAKDHGNTELYNNRGGKCLIHLSDAYRARQVLRDIKAGKLP